MRHSSLATLVVSAVLATLGASSVAADTLPPTLSTEFFVADSVSITASCNPGSTSTMSFSATGVAVGTYPGTFTESGIVTIGSRAGRHARPRDSALRGDRRPDVLHDQLGDRPGHGHAELMIAGSVSGLCNDFGTPSPFGSSLITRTFRELNPDSTGFG